MSARKDGKNGNGARRGGGSSARNRSAIARAARKVERFRQHPLRSVDPGQRPKGKLLIIGGAENRDGSEPLILAALAKRVGSGALVLVTAAGELPEESWKEYEGCFRRLGVRHLRRLAVNERRDAESPSAMRALENATGIFFTGGDQLRITSLVGDTPVYSRCQEIFREGGTIAGTSAGAAVMGETMIVRGNTDSHRVRAGDLQLAPGFGFAQNMVVDQHFAERGRIGRLLGVVGQNPRILGIGIDENTAIEVDPFRSFRVIGEGGVYVVDGATVTGTNVADEDVDRVMSLCGLTLHVLGQGDRFALETRCPTIRPAKEVDEELEALVGAHGSHHEDGADEEDDD